MPKREDRPRIPIPEELLKYTLDTLKVAAKKLKVGASTLRRHIKKVPTKIYWGFGKPYLSLFFNLWKGKKKKRECFKRESRNKVLLLLVWF
ncbi:hypothetical protein RHGRI_030264 [Rhododendron griersonianum]|uniref:HTH psq-type domain-containing protein n=1 Tax=Rhododendron griersonianum TaxID=479676 RepID=A0AAV6IQV6_9ERIC|nr:hypothetical protein RHGRI_030264 [Rhododendron griersonianum]